MIAATSTRGARDPQVTLPGKRSGVRPTRYHRWGQQCTTDLPAALAAIVPRHSAHRPSQVASRAPLFEWLSGGIVTDKAIAAAITVEATNNRRLLARAAGSIWSRRLHGKLRQANMYASLIFNGRFTRHARYYVRLSLTNSLDVHVFVDICGVRRSLLGSPYWGPRRGRDFPTLLFYAGLSKQ